MLMALKHHNNNNIGDDCRAYCEVGDYHTRRLIIRTKCIKHKRVLHFSSYWNNMNITNSLSGSDDMRRRTVEDYCLQGSDAV
jgi:hypothetical protein